MSPLGADDPRVGSVLADRYRIHALIGEGGMGKVYAAEHVLMKKRLAVKVLHRELTSVPDVVARFEREAMAAANIEHPNVAAATDFGKLADGSVFLVLEFVQGQNLREEVARGPLPIERALHIARQIAAGLGSAHAQGIVHRDLKPENVMLVHKAGDEDFVKVLDFGIAKVPIGEMPSLASAQDQPITRAGMVFGTPEYMAPEQALGQTVDGRADLYALGVMLFEMLAGIRPFSSQSAVGILGQQLAHPPPTFAARAPGVLVPPAVEQIVHRLLARDREQRYASAADVVATLDVLLAPVAGRGGYRFTLADGSPDAAPEAGPASAPPTRSLDTPIPRFANTMTSAALPPFDAAAAEQGARPIAPAPRLPRESMTAKHRLQAFRARLSRFIVDLRAGALGPKLRAALASIGPRAEGLRERLPAPIRKSLRPVPTRALVLAGALSFAVVVLLTLAVGAAILRALRGDEPSAPAPASALPSPSAAPAPSLPSAAPPVELAAGQGDPVLLEALASKYPRDPVPLVHAARAWLAAKELVKANGAIGRALELDPEIRNDGRVAAVLFQTAQGKSSGDAAFALLTGPMAARGADILWDLAAEPAVKPAVRQRAGVWLRSPAFRRNADASLALAAELRTAKSCDAARALLGKARQVGDERSLSQLEAWRKTDGCGPNKRADCMPCLREGNELEEAIAAIRSRQKNAGGAAVP